MTPKLGDYGVQSGGGWGGWLIRLGTFSRYGHAAVVVQEFPQLRIVEATPGGARERACNADEFVWSRCNLAADQRLAIATLARTCIGLPYDWKDIVFFVLRFFGAKVFHTSSDHADSRLICSELVAWCYREVKHEVAPTQYIAPGDVSPGDLADHMTRGDV